MNFGQSVRSETILLEDIELKASQQELLEDDRDFMRDRHIQEWASDHLYVLRRRQRPRTQGTNHQTFEKGIEPPNPAICINVIVGLSQVTTYLLDRLIKSRHL